MTGCGTAENRHGKNQEFVILLFFVDNFLSLLFCFHTVDRKNVSGNNASSLVILNTSLVYS